MADGMTFEMVGMDDFLREIRMLPDSIRTRVLKGAVATGAKVMRKDAVARAPIFSGKVSSGHPPPGTLKRAIYQTRMTQLCSDTQEVWKVDVRRGKTAVSTRGKNKGVRNLGQDAFYAMWVEYGHYTRTPGTSKKEHARLRGGVDLYTGSKWVPAQPFMRPAFTSTQSAVLEAMGNYIDNNLKDAVAAMRYVKALA
jgi:HK97 gp10 family phage protein